MPNSESTGALQITELNTNLKADVIVVLGAAVRPGGIPSPALRRRVLHAVTLFHHGISGNLMFTGGIGKYPPSEADIMRRLALENGIPNDHIILEATATSTVASAIACSKIIKEKGWATAILVSDRYHLFRSVSLFRRLGIDVHGNAPAEQTYQTRPWRLRYAKVREWIAYPWSLIRLYMRR